MPAFAEAAGRVVRTGKRKPRVDERTPKLVKYATGGGRRASLPRLKASVVRSNLVGPSWGMMLNDELGDCTVAAAGHAVQVVTATVSAGSGHVTIPDSEIAAGYWATGSPPVVGADDTGRVELDVLNYWHNAGIGGHRLHAFGSIDLRHLHGQTRWAIDLLGFVYLGVGLPVTAQHQAVWKLVPGAGSDADPWSWGGHAVIAVDYDKSGVTVVTWGRLVKMTWGFYKKYCDEAYGVILPEWLDATGRSIDGFDLAALEADLAAIT